MIVVDLVLFALAAFVLPSGGCPSAAPTPGTDEAGLLPRASVDGHARGPWSSDAGPGDRLPQ